jgi:hypothetical protein
LLILICSGGVALGIIVLVILGHWSSRITKGGRSFVRYGSVRRQNIMHSFVHPFLRACVFSPFSFLLQELEISPEQFEVLLHPDDDEDQQDEMASAIEANCIPPNPEEEGEE